MQYTVTGKIVKVGSIIPCTGKIREKLTFIIRDEDDDNREIAFILFDANIGLFMEPLELGDKVRVTFSIKSREYQGSYTTNCFALSVEKIEEKKKERRSRGKSKEYSEWERNAYNTFAYSPPWQSQQTVYPDYFKDCKNAQDAKKLYRKLSMECHPDRPGGNKEKFQSLSNQYERWK